MTDQQAWALLEAGAWWAMACAGLWLAVELRAWRFGAVARLHDEVDDLRRVLDDIADGPPCWARTIAREALGRPYSDWPRL